MRPLIWLSVLSFALSSVATPDADFGALEARQTPRKKATVYTACTVANTIALTFDDGPYDFTRKAADAVKAAGGKATFFVNGNNWVCGYKEPYTSTLKYIFDQGHQVGSHTWRHKDLKTISWDSMHDQMHKTETFIKRVTGAFPAFMRPPYGSYNDTVLEAAYLRNQSIAMWSYDSGDTAGLTMAQQKSRFDTWLTVPKKPTSGNILMHDIHNSTVTQLLPYMITKLKANGFRLVTLAECMGKPPYFGPIVAPSPRNSTTWVC